MDGEAAADALPAPARVAGGPGWRGVEETEEEQTREQHARHNCVFCNGHCVCSFIG